MTKTLQIFRGISYLLLGIVLLVSSYGYIKKEARDRDRAAMAISCTNSGGEVTSTSPYCVCPEMFPVLDDGQKFCRDRYGAHVRTREEFLVAHRRYIYANDCRSRGNEVYVLGGTKLTMCYNQVWGDPVVTRDVGVYRVAFVSSTARTKIETLVWWYGEGDVLPAIPGFSPECFNCLSTTTPEADLVRQIGLRGNGRLIAGSLGGYSAFKVTSNMNGRSLLVVPQIFGQAYLAVSVPSARVKEAEVAIKDIWFDEYVN